MATSVVEICNRALDYLGQSPITSLEDNSKAANACRRGYPLSRDYVLRSYPWNSAVRRARLAALATAPEWGFARQFQLPVDCLRVIDSEGDLDGEVWRREGNLLLTDAAAPLNIRYVAAITDPAQMDSMLTECIAAHLASALAFAVQGSNETQQRAFATFQGIIRQAQAMDARESSQDEVLVANTWLNARF
jgi:hypothetical protein